jgi:molybdopterin-guanine dinucleotide biosynthesis protein A
MSGPLTSGAGFDAIILAGGTSRRMGGGDKTALAVGGTPLLDRVLAAVPEAEWVIVVGAERPTRTPVRWTREAPAGAGPAAAVAQGLTLAEAPTVVLLAGDLPFVTRATVARLLARAAPNGAVLADADGIPQWLTGAWPRALLDEALAGDPAGASLRKALAPLQPALLTAVAGRPEWFDCDAPDDLARARDLLEGKSRERDEPARRMDGERR